MDLEALCALLEDIGRKIETQKIKKSAKSIALTDVMEKLEDIMNALSESSRIRYIMINTLELWKNGWPEKKSIKNERSSRTRNIKNSDRKHYGSLSPRKKNFDNKSYSKFEKLEYEKSVNKFDKNEVLERIPESLESYMNIKNAQLEEFKILSENSVESLEVIRKIFTASAANSEIIKKISKNIISFVEYIYKFGDDGIYDYNELVKGINSYIQYGYESDLEENSYLEMIIKELYMYGLNKQYFTLLEIHFINKLRKYSQDDFPCYIGRIELSHKLLMELNSIGYPYEELKQFFNDETEVMIKLSDIKDINVNIINSFRALFSPYLYAKEMFEKGKDNNFNEMLKSEKLTPQFIQDIGQAMIVVIIEDKKLNVYC